MFAWCFYIHYLIADSVWDNSRILILWVRRVSLRWQVPQSTTHLAEARLCGEGATRRRKLCSKLERTKRFHPSCIGISLLEWEGPRGFLRAEWEADRKQPATITVTCGQRELPPVQILCHLTCLFACAWMKQDLSPGHRREIKRERWLQASYCFYNLVSIVNIVFETKKIPPFPPSLSSFSFLLPFFPR